MTSSEQIAAGFQQGFNVFIHLDMDFMLDFHVHVDGDRLFGRRHFNARRAA